ncbi:hypothetical protein R3P38DRAFT_3301834 [Favolaschia claudopus]|uniref:Ribosomal RNA-processing protein 36 n=1 Tax=Favolaschia claudopus TaxID=2862362 RepID=A0AAW0EHV3_9AGAR
MSVRDLVHRYESGSTSRPPPPSPARFLPPKPPPRSIPTPSSQLTTSATLIDDLSRHSDSDSDDETIYKPSPSAESSTVAHSTLHRRTTTPHTPVPATVVFARNAPSLSLPDLDKHLSKLEPPAFTQPTAKDPVKFPPMDQLARLGSTIDDLEYNFKIAPWWRNRTTLLGSTVNAILSITGSSAVATFYRLQGLTNTVQVFALILTTIVPLNSKVELESQWRNLMLGKMSVLLVLTLSPTLNIFRPNILALNFASTLNQSLVFLVVFLLLTLLLLYSFHRASFHCDRYRIVEGLQQTETLGSRTSLVVITFLLVVLYLPLSALAVHVLVFPPVVSPLGPANEYKDPLDFCWTTTMRRDEVNWAPVIIILAAFVVISLTVWFPLALRKIILVSVPDIDRYSELGRRRNNEEMDSEYHRLLDRDLNPFVFLYNGFRRNWATYEAIYLFAKLSALLVIAVIDPNNCLFRSFSRTAVPLVRQVTLLVMTLGFFITQCVVAPFLDPVNNASEWVSRLNYVITSATALAVAANVPGKDIINTYVLYLIYVITYGFSIYFTLINTALIQRAVKRLTRRIDFSIDIFSPRLDTSATSAHTKRRIWQESVTTLLLISPDCRIPAKQPIEFSDARDAEFPPYLLNFSGTPGERHVENVKILREIGSINYHKSVALTTGPDFEWFKHLEEDIQKHFIGPDSYWKGHNTPDGVTSPFGNAWWIPFPPTLVIRYDDGPTAVLRDVSDLEAYVNQNSSKAVRRKREIRMALRALEGRIVVWPYIHITPIGSNSLWCCNRGYTADNSTAYHSCVLRIKRRGHLEWEGLQLGSGFSVELNYAKSVKVAGDIIGLNDDYDLTPDLAQFLSLNQHLIPTKLKHIEETLARYRRHHRKECRWKSDVLTYRFLTHVYDRPRPPSSLAESSFQLERDLRVRQLMAGSVDVFETAFDRLEAVSVSPTSGWWYLFWDDLWRRNHDTIRGLEVHATDFDPHYPTSIAYRPLPRPALEAFLTQRGLFSKQQVFHSGFLNKLYLRLNDTVFHGSRAILFHLGDHASELEMGEVDRETQAQSSILGTGVGTDHDAVSIVPRPTYRWEGLLRDPYHPGKVHRRLLSKLGAWLGLTPLWRAGTPSHGLALDIPLWQFFHHTQYNASTSTTRFTSSSERTSRQNISYSSRGLKVENKNISNASSEAESVDDDGSSDSEEAVSGDEEEDADAPRVSQWVDDDDLEDTAESNHAGPSQLKSLEEDLSSVPLGALVRAQRALKQAEASDSESEDFGDDETGAPPENISSGKEKAKPEWSIEPRHDIAKRTNKHAPVELTSKRPVTRKRQVVEVKTVQPRDPRFLPLAGEFSQEKFQKHYGFLTDAHKTELQTLRESLKAARKLLASSPRDLRSEREAEVSRLEKAVKRAESLVNQDRKSKVDQAALTKLNEAEKAKRADGKAGWWMKNSEKKDFLLRARYDALAREGGKRAVKKAIEKKQKKIGQKEKKSRPFAKDNGLKRRPTDTNEGPPQKRRRS